MMFDDVRASRLAGGFRYRSAFSEFQGTVVCPISLSALRDQLRFCNTGYIKDLAVCNLRCCISRQPFPLLP